MESLFFEEFNEGDVSRTRGRTITEADIVAFSVLSWCTNPQDVRQELFL